MGPLFLSSSRRTWSSDPPPPPHNQAVDYVLVPCSRDAVKWDTAYCIGRGVPKIRQALVGRGAGGWTHGSVKAWVAMIDCPRSVTSRLAEAVTIERGGTSHGRNFVWGSSGWHRPTESAERG